MIQLLNQLQKRNTDWKKLKRVWIISAGEKIHLTNFKNYLSKANSLKQEVLVELKINSTITNNKLRNFVSQYGKDMQKNHTQIQSLNQNSLTRLEPV